MIEEESKEDPSEPIYDLPECFLITWEELMDRTSTTTTGYDIWNEEVPEPKNYSNGGRHFEPQSSYPTPTNGGRHFKPQVNNQIPINGGRHFESQSNGPTSINREGHFKPQDTDLNDPTKIDHITWGGDTSNAHI